MLRKAFYGILIAVASLMTWDAAVAARREAAQAKKTKAAGAHELSCDMHARKQLLGQLPEASGLALSRRAPGLLWSADDSDDPVVFAIDTAGGAKGMVRIGNATVKDWEDVSVGSCADGSCLYVADIGDNSGNRTQITVYRLPEPGAGTSETARADALLFEYPDGPHDAEAMFVTPDRTLFIITKGRETTLYRAPADARPGAVAKLIRVAALSLDRVMSGEDSRKQTRITDAETSGDGKWVALRTNEDLFVVPTQQLVAGSMTNAWHADLHALDEPQGEGVAMSNDGDVYLAGEGGGHGLPGTLVHIKCELPRAD